MNSSQRQFQIELTDSQGMRYPVTLTCESDYWDEGECRKRRCTISTAIRGEQITCSDRDFFEAFCRVRELLESEGLIPLCYGASKNVFPSGMLRDMSDGLRAYRLVMGQRALPSDGVSIFDMGSDVEPVSVQDQAEFYRRWIESPILNRRRTSA